MANDSLFDNEQQLNLSGRSQCCLVATSAVCFQILASVVASWGTPKHVKSQWKWKNTAVSFIHSTLSGSTALLCFYLTPSMAEDVIKSPTLLASCLICGSFGYFIYDTIDLFRYLPFSKSWELLLHHAVCLSSLITVVFTNKYGGFVVMGLLIEINSVFLHFRSLLNMYGTKRNSLIYRLNGLANMGTFIAFRISTFTWMTRWILMNRDLIPLGLYSVVSIGMAILTVSNIILLWRLIFKDFIRQNQSGLENKATKVE